MHTRTDIIAALQQYSEAYTGDILDNYNDYQLFQELEKVAAETDFTASELIAGLTKGF